MYKGTDFVGKPVISHVDGKILGNIKDIIFDSNQAQVLGFILEDKGIFSKGKVLPLENIQSIEPDSITILNQNAIMEPDKHIAIAAALSEKNKDWGKISNVFFNESGDLMTGV